MKTSVLALRLKKAGYSLTKPRQDVFELLSQESPLTMYALWKKLEHSTNRASIYRTVALFEDLGIAQRINRGWKYTLELTDEFVPHHHHFTCFKCNKVTNFDEPVGLEMILQELSADNNFEVRSHTLEIEGLCAECKYILNF